MSDLRRSDPSPATAARLGGAGGVGGATAPQSSTLTRKLKKVLDIPMDDTMRTCLEAISDVYMMSDDGPEKRELTHADVMEKKSLRSALDARTLGLHAQFLNEFRLVSEQFERVAGDVSRLTQSCAQMSSALKQTRADSMQMTDHLSVLHGELDEAKAKEEQVKTFLTRFHLTAEDKAVLHRDISAQFFTVLEKVKDIHSHCADLLNAQHQQAGVEVMEMTYLQQTQGYERLYRWVHQQTQSVMSADTPDVPTLYVRALNTLKDRGPLWCTCMRDLAQVRRTTVVRKLFLVLSEKEAAGGGGGASDPLHFIADVLAWVHQCVAEEADLLDNFFAVPAAAAPPAAAAAAATAEAPAGSAPATAEATPLLSASGAIFEVSKADLLDTVFEGTVRPIRVKVEAALQATPVEDQEHSLVTFFKLESILQFYCSMVSRLLGKNAALSQLLSELKLTTLKNFFDVLKKVSDKILASTCHTGSDLAPPPVIYEALGKLRLMMDTLADSLTPPEDRESEFSAVLSGIVDPLLTVVERVGDLDAASHATLLVNCLHLTLSTFSEQPFTRNKSRRLEEKVAREVGKLVALQSELLVRRSGLAEVVGKIVDEAANGGTQPLAAFSTTSPDAVQDAVQTFYKYMYTLGSASLPLGERIQSAAIKQDVNTRTIKAICDAYQQVWIGCTHIHTHIHTHRCTSLSPTLPTSIPTPVPSSSTPLTTSAPSLTLDRSNRTRRCNVCNHALQL